MSLTGEHLAQLSQLVETSQSVVLVLPSGAAIDETAAALAWASILRRKGKEVLLVSPVVPSAGFAGLDGAGDITTQLGKQNLVLSFAYTPEQVDKVSYHIGEETNRFYLTIKPKKGEAPLAQDSLEINYAGAEADLLVYIGVDDLEQLQPISGEYVEFFRDTPSIVLASNDTPFGTVKILTSAVAGLCEESARLFMQLGWDIDEAVATPLLRGIEDATLGLTSLATTPDTFETVAVLLRAGARRNHRHTASVEQPALLQKQVEMSQTLQYQNMHEEDVAVPQAVAKPPKTFADVLKRGAASPLPNQQEVNRVEPTHKADERRRKMSQAGRYQGRKRQRSAQG